MQRMQRASRTASGPTSGQTSIKLAFDAKNAKGQQDRYSGGGGDKYNFYNREKEIKEIDSRLKSLQLFMKNNMP